VKWLSLTIILLLTTLSLSCISDSFPTAARGSFIKVRNENHFEVCDKQKECTIVEDLVVGSQGSGAVIATNSIGVFILTAEHVCRKMDKKVAQMFGNILIPQKIRKKKKIRTKKKMHVHTFMGDKSIADIVAMDEELDTCILFAKRLSVKPLKRYYGELDVGEKYYNIASPLGSAETKFVPLLEGRFLGNYNRFTTSFSIPAAPGSSGSPIIDGRGRLVGVLHSVIRGFHHVTFASDITLLNRFIDDNITDYYDSWHRNMLELTRPKTN
jgi:S1-C subfamily serine protease